MVENSDSKTEKVEEKKDNKTEQNPATTQEKISALIFLFVVGYVIYSLVSCVNNGSSSSSSNNKSVSKDGIQACNVAVDAFNAAFTSNKYFKADATILKLKAVKAEVNNELGEKVSCNVFIKNEGDKVIKEIIGYLYYFDKDNVSDKTSIIINNVIRPNETIKYQMSYISKNTTKAEIRNRAGDSIFNYDYTIDFNSNK